VNADSSEPVRDLARLLREMRPRLHEGTVAFCELTFAAEIPEGVIAWIREAEGETVILPLASAREAQLTVAFEAAWITLEVHSALEAVGLTAAASAALAAEGIACNVVAALRHDHLFVPVARAADAMTALHRLSSGA
jgi:hypothetical protein